VPALALGAAIWFGRFTYLRITLRPTPRPEYWRAQLEALDPLPPGALSAGEGFGLLTNPPWVTADAIEPADRKTGPSQPRPLEGGIPSLHGASRISFSDPSFIRARANLIEALAKGWPPDGEPGLRAGTDALTGENGWPWVLLAHARWSRRQLESTHNAPAERKDFAAVREDWLALLRLAHQVGRNRRWADISLMAGLEAMVAEDMDAVAILGFENLDTAAWATEADAARLILGRPSQYFDGERLAGYAKLEEVFVREGGDWLDVSSYVKSTRKSTPRAGLPTPTVSRWWNLGAPLFHSLAEARAAHDRWFELIDGLTSVQEVERVRWDYRPNSPIGWRPSFLDGPCDFPDSIALQTLLDLYAVRTRFEVMLTRLALRAYHDRTGRYPEQLEGLVPQYLPRLPISYLDRKPLHYWTDGSIYGLSGSALPPLNDGSSESQP
jgi:hypothetical protein